VAEARRTFAAIGRPKQKGRTISASNVKSRGRDCHLLWEDLRLDLSDTVAGVPDESRPTRLAVASSAGLMVLLAGCGPRAARPTSVDDEHVPADAALASGSGDGAVTTGVTESGSGSPDPGSSQSPPHETLPWVNPSRCLAPCTYDPRARLVRVDKDGVEDPAGSHMVDRAIQAPLRDLVVGAHAAGHQVGIV
jgi:hypothetical protein